MIHWRTGRIAEADQLVRRFHYSARWPSNVQMVATGHADGGLFGDDGECLAALTFSIPPTRWSEPVWELSRLVRREGAEINLTALIAFACKVARAQGADLLVSFADWTQGHHGGIYQAASWNFAGKRDRAMDGVMIGGAFVPGRSCNSAFGTRSPARLAVQGIDALPHYDEGKALYWRALNRVGKAKAARLELSALPYWKPSLDAAPAAGAK